MTIQKIAPFLPVKIICNCAMPLAIIKDDIAKHIVKHNTIGTNVSCTNQRKRSFGNMYPIVTIERTE